MALLTLSAAARATGKDRSTLHRRIKSGELSAIVTPDGKKRIDTAELERVFGPLDGHKAPEATPDPAQDAIIEMLRGQLRQAADREQWLKAQLEQEQATRRELETRLLTPPEKRPGFWKRVFGHEN